MKTHMANSSGSGAACKVWRHGKLQTTEDAAKVDCRACLSKMRRRPAGEGRDRQTDRQNAIELTVRLVDGSFESRVQLPVDANDTQRKGVLLAWFNLIEQALDAAKWSA